jgi:UDP:flavonoid glycosyltransferase YjiC (YdhE family)
MKRILTLATAGAGGDLQPLIAVTLELLRRGHQIRVLGDNSVASTIKDLGIETIVLPPTYDFGPRLIAAIRDGQTLEPAAQGELVQQRTAAWSKELAARIQPLIHEHKPDFLLTSLFGAGVASMATSATSLPWCVINSTFYVGPNPPRALESDFSSRAVPLIRYFMPLLAQARLVLHATDSIFDFGNVTLPPKHHYVGPLIWETRAPIPSYLNEPGDPWVLVTLSSQQQDDIALAQVALQALAHQPVRVFMTLGGGHQPSEINQIPDNARVEQYVPHSKVLEQSKLLISHAGHGSVMKALWYGVPMVLIPWGRDQPGVAARAAHLGVAKVVVREQLTDERLSEAINGALEDRQIQNTTRETSQRLRSQHPAALACELLEQI